MPVPQALQHFLRMLSQLAFTKNRVHFINTWRRPVKKEIETGESCLKCRASFPGYTLFLSRKYSSEEERGPWERGWEIPGSIYSSEIGCKIHSIPPPAPIFSLISISSPYPTSLCCHQAFRERNVPSRVTPTPNRQILSFSFRGLATFLFRNFAVIQIL